MSEKSFFKNITDGINKRVGKILVNPYKEVNLSWLKIKYYKHLPADKLRHHNLFGKRLYFYSGPELLHGLQEIFLEKIYEIQLPEVPYIIDCGANIGMSVIYLKERHPQAEIIAFEPDETNFNLLSRNIDSYGYTNVQLHKEAVWNENKSLLFSNKSSMGSKIEMSNTIDSIEVKAVRLKDFLTREVDFLKIDIEGAENVVMADIADCLYFVKNLFLEYHGTFAQNSELAGIINILNNAGFNFYIKEAAPLYPTPFKRQKNSAAQYDVQLNIFCFRDR